LLSGRKEKVLGADRFICCKRMNEPVLNVGEATFSSETKGSQETFLLIDSGSTCSVVAKRGRSGHFVQLMEDGKIWE
jgi:hypothetical protein